MPYRRESIAWDRRKEPATKTKPLSCEGDANQNRHHKAKPQVYSSVCSIQQAAVRPLGSLRSKRGIQSSDCQRIFQASLKRLQMCTGVQEKRWTRKPPHCPGWSYRMIEDWNTYSGISRDPLERDPWKDVLEALGSEKERNHIPVCSPCQLKG